MLEGSYGLPFTHIQVDITKDIVECKLLGLEPII